MTPRPEREWLSLLIHIPAIALVEEAALVSVNDRLDEDRALQARG
jgi:hypothetical protein